MPKGHKSKAWDHAKEIYEAHRAGTRAQDLADRYGCSFQTIFEILRRERKRRSKKLREQTSPPHKPDATYLNGLALAIAYRWRA